MLMNASTVYPIVLVKVHVLTHLVATTVSVQKAIQVMEGKMVKDVMVGQTCGHISNFCPLGS